jgi:hypothetical protein
MKLGIGIMGHEKRAQYIEELLERLDAPATVVLDRENDRWDTGRRTMYAHREQPDATHWLILQDDAVVSRDLYASVSQALEFVPNNPISLFFSYGTNGAHQRTNRLARVARRPGWVVFEGPWWGVAVVFPVKLIPAMMELADRPRESRAYDKRLSGALGKMGVDTYYILPSLVDHRIDGPSLIEGREQNGRRAHHFIGAKASALSIDWAKLPVTNGHLSRNGRIVARRRLTPPRHARPVLLTPPSVPVAGPRKVSCTVMAHKARAALVGPLLEALGGAEVVWDEAGDRWDTGRRAMESFDPSADVHCVLQDDAIVCRDLLAGVAELTRYTDGPVSLYTGKQNSTAVHLAIAEYTNAPFFRAPGPHWGVGLAMPTSLVLELVKGAGGLRGIHAYDMRMQRWLRAQGIQCSYTVPSLVDHRQGPSLLSHPQAGRRAVNFIGQDSSALDTDWSREPGPLPESGYIEVAMGSRKVFACCECLSYKPQEGLMQAHVRRHQRVRV